MDTKNPLERVRKREQMNIRTIEQTNHRTFELGKLNKETVEYLNT